MCLSKEDLEPLYQHINIHVIDRDPNKNPIHQLYFIFQGSRMIKTKCSEHDPMIHLTSEKSHGSFHCHYLTMMKVEIFFVSHEISIQVGFKYFG